MRSLLILPALVLLSAPALAEDPLPVEFVPVAPQPLTFDASLTGTLEARDSVDLGFRQGGRVIDILVEEGDRVSAGQSLAQTDPVQQNQALQVAEASLAAAQATLAQAQQAADRAQAMLDRGVGTRAGRDQAEQALSQAEGAVSRATSQTDQARRAVEDTVIHAPTDGVVTARNADPGQIVGAAQTVLSLAADGALEAVFHTPDLSDLNKAMGAIVALSPIDVNVADMTGRITEIAPLVDPLTGTVTVRALVDKAPADSRLLGAAVRGTVAFPAGTAIAIPWTALTRDGTEPAVWLVGQDGRVSLARVQVARFANDEVFLSDGLEEGQIVVGAGSQMLFPDRQVIDAATIAGASETSEVTE